MLHGLIQNRELSLSRDHGNAFKQLQDCRLQILFGLLTDRGKPSMRRHLSLILLLLGSISYGFSLLIHTRPQHETNGISSRSHTLQQPSDRNYLPGVVVVKFKSAIRHALGKTSVQESSLNFVFNKYSVYETRQLFPQHEQAPPRPEQVDLSRIYMIRYNASNDAGEAAKDFAREEVVEYAEPHYIHRVMFTPNDPMFNVNQWYLKKIHAEQAWDITQGDTSVVIGIIDTGVDWVHPDLAANIWMNPRPGGNPQYPNDIRGWDFGGLHGTPDNDPNEDQPDHGTAIAGLASSVTNNGIGIAGMGFKSKIMAVKVTQDDQRNASGPLILYGYEGIVYAADNGAAIINCSWGRPGKQSTSSKYEQEVINYAYQKDALVVAAVGNANTSTRYTPAAYNHVLAVAATDPNDHRSVWSYDFASNYGPWVDVTAPGSAMFSTWKENSYTYSLNGTSFASALVSGVAALVKSLHPSWTPDQVAEQVRVAADKIDSLNPGFAGQLGSGRVNAYRAVTQQSPAVRVVSVIINDWAGGNNDGIADPGETISIVMTFENFLAPASNAQVEITTTDPYVTMVNGTLITLGTLGTLDSVSNRMHPMVVKISPSVPENYEISFAVSVVDSDYRDVTTFGVPVQPTFRDMNINDVVLTMTSSGSLGFNDFPANLQGSGFTFKNIFQNLLLEGALMVGVSGSKVSNVARDETGVYPNRHFVTLQDLRVATPGTVADQEGVAIFNDDGAGTNKIGIRVTLRSYAFVNPPDEKYVMLKYTLENTADSTITNLHAGLFFDWDINGGSNNVADFDRDHRMGYVYDTGSAVGTYVGVTLVSPDGICYRAIDNAGKNGWGIYDGFSLAEKWEALSGGTSSHLTAGPGDVSHVVSAGPLEIAPGQKKVIGFAVMGGDSLADLRSTAETAMVKWKQILDSNEMPPVPYEFALYQNYPNPFNPTTTIKYQVANSGFVTLRVFDLLGREVTSLVQEYQTPGLYQVAFDARSSMSSSLASGVYFCDLQVSTASGKGNYHTQFRDVKKMLILK